MVSSIGSAPTGRVRKTAVERRAEIIRAAAAIALDQGLERITLRAVAERLGVRPGLISHYFAAVDELVVEAFVHAAVDERERFFPHAFAAEPLDGIRHFLRHVTGGASRPLARMWLNARHLCRFVPGLVGALDEQDALDRARLTALVAAAEASGAIAATDPKEAAIRMLLAVDGLGSYANLDPATLPDVHDRYLVDAFAAALGVDAALLEDGSASGGMTRKPPSASDAVARVSATATRAGPYEEEA